MLMPKFFGEEADEPFDDAIDDLLGDLRREGSASEEYPKLLGYVERLTKASSLRRPERKFSWDTVLIVGGNLLGIAGIMLYEQRHVWATRAMNQQIRPR
jgi:hypothetical protein